MTTPIHSFDPCAPLSSGISMIEASAGTGKTYSISNLFLRLVAEAQLSPEHILVVTYTEAATAELRERIRLRLREALEALGSEPTENPVLNHLQTIYRQDPKIKSRLRRALEEFDQASISTIHGFCRKVLQHNAFESGSSFDIELVSDFKTSLKTIVDDFWVQEFHSAPAFWLKQASSKKNGTHRDQLYRLASEVTNDPQLAIVPETSTDGIPSTEALEALKADLKKLWKSRQDIVSQIEAAIEKSTPWVLCGRSYRAKYTNARLREMEQWLGSDQLVFPKKSATAITPLDYFSWARLKEKSKAESPPEHPLLLACDTYLSTLNDFTQQVEESLVALKHRFVAKVRSELTKRKKAQSKQSFDDLLRGVHSGLHHPTLGPVLKQAIRKNLSVALIDEFQDTDRIQWEIFKDLFDSPNTALYLIGDPKQAIYGFRGAEIFTYLKAKESTPTEARFNLGTNYRSDVGVVDAVNALFQAPPESSRLLEAPFVNDGFEFHPVKANHLSPRFQRDNTGGGIEVRYLLREQAEIKPSGIDKKWAQKAIAAQTAQDLALLLQSHAKIQINGKPDKIRPRDIAILVRNKHQGADLKASLTQLGIPSVLHGSISVYKTEQAQDLKLVLNAIANPSRHTHLRQALTTSLMGYSGHDLQKLSQNESQWAQTLQLFHQWSVLWHTQGFMPLYRCLLNQTNALERLLTLHDGERQLTNYNHLAELIHEHETTKRLEPAGLLLWYKEIVLSGPDDTKASELRLETDSDAVEIVTIHKSKGLEYPIVFCPFLWGDSQLKTTEKTHTRYQDNGRYSLDVSIGNSADKIEHQDAALIENLAENLRLTYVALTRASVHCIVYWGWFEDADTSSLAYLLHQDGSAKNGRDILNSIQARFKTLDDETMLAELAPLVGDSNNAITIHPFNATSEDTGDVSFVPDSNSHSLSRHEFSRTHPVVSLFGRSSFSHMTQDKSATLSGPTAEGMSAGEDHKLPAPLTRSVITPMETEVPLWDFPRGPTPGTFLHRILELWDFQESNEEVLESLIRKEGLRFQLWDAQEASPPWLSTLTESLLSIAQTPLAGADNQSFCLNMIQRRSRLDELSFDFPIHLDGSSFSPRDLEALFTAFPNPSIPKGYPNQLGRLGFAPLRGFMTGSIDLTLAHNNQFYIADYKSNHLGDFPNDYRSASILEAMNHHHYFLQYHIYTVALHRYLRWKLQEAYTSKADYERFFGGVYYLFLRGMQPESTNGVFFDRPPYELIEALSEGFGSTMAPPNEMHEVYTC